jgi:hypothetical protein
MSADPGRRRFLGVGAAAGALAPALTLGAFPAAVQGAPSSASAGAADPPKVAHLLANLGPNEGRTLGRLRIEGHFNDTARRFGLHRTGPRSRDYSLKTVWCPTRRTALYAGANHGSPHRLNDVWEFDLALPGWRLLYAPDLPRSYAGLGDDASDVVFRDGVLQTMRGGPAIIGHTWWGLTWDAQRERLLFMNTWVADEAAAIRLLGGEPQERFSGPPLWSFDPAAGRWAFVRTTSPAPKAPFGSMLEYIPALGGAVWHANHWQFRGTWLLDTSSDSWRALITPGTDPQFERHAPVREAVGWFDPSRGLLVAHEGYRSHHVDGALRWREVGTAHGQGPDVHDARTPAFYDPVSREGLLLDRKNRRLWAWNPDAARWKAVTPAGDPMPTGARMLACLDLSRNALVVADDTTAWVYRYRVS